MYQIFPYIMLMIAIKPKERRRGFFPLYLQWFVEFQLLSKQFLAVSGRGKGPYLGGVHTTGSHMRAHSGTCSGNMQRLKINFLKICRNAHHVVRRSTFPSVRTERRYERVRAHAQERQVSDDHHKSTPELVAHHFEQDVQC